MIGFSPEAMDHLRRYRYPGNVRELENIVERAAVLTTRPTIGAETLPDNVVSDGARTLGDLGITPVSLEAVLPEYLWRFRPSGQYAAIKESAKNLRS